MNASGQTAELDSEGRGLTETFKHSELDNNASDLRIESDTKQSTTPHPRIDGIDMARGLAIIGMMVAHLYYCEADFSGGVKADAVIGFFSNGYPSALFAILAGVSLALMSERAAKTGGQELAQSRFKLIVRGSALILGGLLLEYTQNLLSTTLTLYGISSPAVAIVLESVGVLFVLLAPLARWRTWRLFITVSVLLLCGPLIPALASLDVAGLTNTVGIGVFLEPYPITAWLTYGIVGMLIYRLVVPNVKRAWICVIGGISVAIVSLVISSILELSPYGFGSSGKGLGSGAYRLGVPSLDFIDGLRIGNHPFSEIASIVGGRWLTGVPHSGGFFDVLSSASLGIAVVGTCLLLCRPRAFSKLFYPLRAMGSMSLTVYVAHVVSVGLIMGLYVGALSGIARTGSFDAQNPIPWEKNARLVEEAESWDSYFELLQQSSARLFGSIPGSDIHAQITTAMSRALLISVLVSLIFCSLWRLRLRRGPLEWCLHACIRTITSTNLPPRDLEVPSRAFSHTDTVEIYPSRSRDKNPEGKLNPAV